MTTIADPIAAVMARLRAGGPVAALAAADAALATRPDDARLRSLAGMLACQTGDVPRGADLLRRALNDWSEDLATRINLATALTQLGEDKELLEICAGGPPDPKLRRLTAVVRQRNGDLDGAAADYCAVVAAAPQDFESWNNLGNIRAAGDDTSGAVAAFEEANRLRPDLVPIYLNLAKALDGGGRTSEARGVLRKSAAIAPTDPHVRHELGLAEAKLQDFAAAERAFRAAIAFAPDFVPALIELGLLLESRNRIDDLEVMIAEAEDADVAPNDLALLKAWLLRRRDRIVDAMEVAKQVSEDIAPLRRHHLLAELHERLGDASAAYEEYVAMNRAARAIGPPPTEDLDYRTEVAHNTAGLTAALIGRWEPGSGEAEDAPVFIMGFPRSGTTLLDTLLMNDPRFHVLEELPIMRQLEALAPTVADLETADPAALRARYAQALSVIAPAPRGAVVVDKYPLHMARLPLIHRAFPNARLVMVERHPCDAVLSCFMSNFTLNRAMRHFTTLEDAAALYDTVFEAFNHSRALLPLNLHTIRYERLVVDLEDEMRGLMAFLGIEWSEAVLDNQSSAARREHIRTASYSQVTEPIYTRAKGRWNRYRAQMAGVMPILAPWCERMGYAI